MCAVANNYDRKFKLMMLGDAGVGKTSIAKRFVDQQFLGSYIHTIGIDFLEKTIECRNLRVRLQIWDTAGQDRFRTLIRPYYRGAAGMLLVYDVTDQKTFNSIEEWMRCIAENTQEFQIIQKVLLANKMDLSKKSHCISREQGQAMADKHHIPFFEVSAKEGQGIDTAFQLLTELVVSAQEADDDATGRSNSALPDRSDEPIVLHEIPIHPKRERKCCQRQ